MKKGALLIGMLAMATFAAASHARASDAYDLERTCRASDYDNVQSCNRYVTAEVNKILFSPHPGICFPQRFSPSQSVPVIVRYIQYRPWTWRRPASLIIWQAIRENYRCR